MRPQINSPLYIFKSGSETGINLVPEDSVFVVTEGSTFVFYEHKTNSAAVTDITTIDEYLAIKPFLFDAMPTSLRVTPVQDETELRAIVALDFMITKRYDNGFEYIFRTHASSFGPSFSASFGGDSSSNIGIPDDEGNGHWFIYDTHKIYKFDFTLSTAGSEIVDTRHPEHLRDKTMVWLNEALQQPGLAYKLVDSTVVFNGAVEPGDSVVIAANPK